MKLIQLKKPNHISTFLTTKYPEERKIFTRVRTRKNQALRIYLNPKPLLLINIERK